MRKLELVQPCDFTPAYGEATDDPAVHRCRGCGHTVRNLSEMRAPEALAFLETRRPGQCVRFRVDDDERIHFADGPSAVVGRVAGNARPMIAVAALVLAACDSSSAPTASEQGAARPEPRVSAGPASAATAAPGTASVGAVSAPTTAGPAISPSAAPTHNAAASSSAAVSSTAAAPPSLPAPHASHRADRVVGRAKSGAPIYEMSGY